MVTIKIYKRINSIQKWNKLLKRLTYYKKQKIKNKKKKKKIKVAVKKKMKQMIFQQLARTLN